MTRRILFVHYTPPGIVGGVEHIMEQHASLLEQRGCIVEIVAGRSDPDGRPVDVIPEINVASPAGQVVEAELADGVISPRFWALRRSIRLQLAPYVSRADAVIAHNAYTLHFSLPLTSVLWDLGLSKEQQTIAWCHDLSWTNPLYIPLMHDGYPWDLLRRPAPNTQYVTVSQERANELNDLWGEYGQSVTVVPNGIDPATFLRLSPEVRSIAERHGLFDRDVVLLLPVRITRRKNIELGLRVVAELCSQGLDVLFLISGPQAPHHPTLSENYRHQLQKLRADLGLDANVVFLADDLEHNPSLETVWQLYSLADVLFLPSKQEGFGLPILEAGLARVPVVLSDIAIFREVGGDDVVFFDVDDDPARIAAEVNGAVSSGAGRLYRRVLENYRWDVVVDRHITPLLEGSTSAGKQGKESAEG